jgi:hypothetical protein
MALWQGFTGATPCTVKEAAPTPQAAWGGLLQDE